MFKSFGENDDDHGPAMPVEALVVALLQKAQVARANFVDAEIARQRITGGEVPRRFFAVFETIDDAPYAAFAGRFTQVFGSVKFEVVTDPVTRTFCQHSYVTVFSHGPVYGSTQHEDAVTERLLAEYREASRSFGDEVWLSKNF